MALAWQINKHINDANLEKPEVIVAIARGALALVKTLADWLNIDRIITPRIIHYVDVQQRLTHPRIYESCLHNLNAKRILLFDNVIETGKTMKLAYDNLSMMGVDKITTAVLFYKQNKLLKPDFYTTTTDAWLIFHFDLVETVKHLGTKWLKQKLSLDEIKKRFLTVGLPEEEITKALKIIFNY